MDVEGKAPLFTLQGRLESQAPRAPGKQEMKKNH